MKKVLLIPILLFFSCVVVFAQTINYQELKKKYPDAAYLTLENKADVQFYTDPASAQVQIKVTYNISLLSLTEDCESVGLIQIPFSSFENINLLSARYFKLDSATNEKNLIENIKVRYAEEKHYYVKSIFYTDLKVKQFASSFDVKEGMVLTYSYERIYKDPKFLTKMTFQEDLQPVLLSSIKITVPSGNKISRFDYNFSGRVQYKESTEGSNTIMQYTATDLPLIKTHTNSPPANYFLPHVILTVNQISQNGKTIDVLTNTNDLYKWYNSLVKELKPDLAAIKTQTEAIIKGLSTDEEKITAVFKWVQNNITYVAFEDGIAGFKPEEAHNVLKYRYADCKGMANLLTCMLSSIGYNASHCWIGTRHLNYKYDCTSLSVDNHMICALNYQNATYLLDATSKSVSWKIVPYYLQGKQALIGMGDTYKIYDIPLEQSNHSNVSINSEMTLTPTGSTLIKGSVSYDGNFDMQITDMLIYFEQKYRDRIHEILIQRDLLGIVNPDQISSLQTSANGRQITFQDKNEQTCIITSDKRYVYPEIDRYLSDVNTDSSNLAVYIDFPHTWKEHTVINTSGYTVLNIPANINYVSPSGFLKASIVFKQASPTQLVFEKEIQINNIYFDNQLREEWNTFIHTIHASYDQPFVLKK